MKTFNALGFMFSVFIIILLLSLTISAENKLNNFNLSESQFADNNYKVNQKLNYSNTDYLHSPNKISAIEQKGSFNKAEILQLGKSGFQKRSLAIIGQKGINNEAYIKQLAGSNKASIKQYGNNNLIKVKQLSGKNSLRIFQFGDDQSLKVKQN